ncbi:MAG: class I mannose-6-phosphate isomerase [Defluviitaleaceae bacterium]|nr:class I mannose-6-phosphate isomerase [Defluviitaleaceae bacterium]
MRNAANDKIAKEPIFFERNRVGRVYRGGHLFGGFFGDDGSDGYLPEEWVASAVKALNKVSAGPKEGVSRIKGTDIYFDELIENYKEELLGGREKLDVLVKMLDSAERLPVQAHPNKAFSRVHFNSEYGKAESWIVVGVRPDAHIFFGFNREITVGELNDSLDKSIDKADHFGHFLNKVSVKPGDVFFIPANCIHAIGPGCMILEVMEPSDFTISPEHWCGDYRLNEYEMFIGLDKDTALSVFDLKNTVGPEFLAKNTISPKVIENTAGVKRETLIDDKVTECFYVNRITVSGGTAVLSNAPSIHIVTDGSGEIIGDGYIKPVSKGDYFFMPAAANGKFSITGNCEVYECLPGK